MLAAAAGSDTTVKELCNGAERTLVDKTDGTQTALHLSAAKGFANVIAELLKGGADPSKKKDGKTALIIAASSGHLEAVKSLAKASGPRSVQYHDVTDNKGWTALHHAVSLGNKLMAEALKDAGANVNAKNGKDITKDDSVLHLAARHWNVMAVNILLHLGAPNELLNKEKVT